MAFTAAPDFTDGILTAAKLQQLSDAINERTPVIGISTRTSNSGTITTTETTVDTVTVVLTSGRVYGVYWYAQVQSSVANDQAGIKIREDSDTGAILANQRAPVLVSTGSGYPIAQFAKYTAVADGSKTFVGTVVRSVGTGNLTAAAGTNQQANIYVVLISA